MLGDPLRRRSNWRQSKIGSTPSSSRFVGVSAECRFNPMPHLGDATYPQLWAPRKIRAFGLRGAMFGREAFFEGFEGSPFQESRLGGPGKGVPSAAMGARVVEMRPLSRYASVAVRSRKANRLMLYTRFIRPIFALARTRPIVRTILPPMLVC